MALYQNEMAKNPQNKSFIKQVRKSAGALFTNTSGM